MADFTPAWNVLQELEDEVVREEAELLAENDAEVAELNRQIAALQAEVASFNTRPKPKVHLVQAGDTLTSIAAAYSTPLSPVTVASLKDWNDLPSDTIRVDDILYLTDGYDAPDPVPDPEPEPAQDYPAYSIDISALGTDANVTEKQKVDGHKALVQPHLPAAERYLRDVRVFFGSRALSWTDARIQALTERDSLIISVSTQRSAAEWDAFLAATPERFRVLPEQVKACYKHECEAEWKAAGKTQAWLDDYYLGNKRISDAMARSQWSNQTKDCVVKIMLWYSQHIDAALKDTMDKFYGGQDFGYFGMDCYHYQVWANNGRYATPQELFGKILAFCRQIGRKCIIPEWGGERAAGDTTGAGRAKAITDGGALLNQNADIVVGANWWCAEGSKDAVTGLPRKHHLGGTFNEEVNGSPTPETLAFRKLAHPEAA